METGVKWVNLIILLLIGIKLPTQANELTDKLTNDDTVQLTIVTEHLPPLQIAGEEKVTGFTTEVIEQALSHTKINSSIVVYPWTRALNTAKNKKNTCIYSMARLSERESRFHWIDTLATTDNYFIGLKKSSYIKINSIEEAKQYRVAVLRDDLTHKLLVKHGFTQNKNLYIVNNTHSLLKLLVARTNIDLVLADKQTIKYRAEFSHLDPAIFKVFLSLNESPLPLYLACNLHTDKKIIQQLTSAMRTIKANGQYQAIKNKWSMIN